MTRTDQAFEVARHAVEAGVWNEMTAFAFVQRAHEMTDEQFQMWVEMAQEVV